jgi:hypothetical protein
MNEWHKWICYCEQCNHRWTGMVSDERQEKLQCPNCKMDKGIAYYPVESTERLKEG